MTYQAEEWLMDLDWEAGKETDRIKPVEVRQSYAKWCAKAWKDIPIDVVYNSWRHNPFSFFPDEPTRTTTYEEEEEYDDSGDDEISITGI